MSAGGHDTFVSAAEVVSHEDLDRRDVTLRGPNGAQQTITRPPALSMGALLVLAGIDPASIDHVDVTRPGGSLVSLTAADLAPDAPFADGPPAVWIDDQSTHFLRPVRDDADVNATDNIATITGQPLAVAVHTGPLLAVTANATPTTPKAGAPVTLTASVAGAPAGLTYTWTLGDGSTATGPSISHAYAQAGRYQPSVAVTGPGDSSGAAQADTIVVGAADAAGTGDSTPGKTDQAGGGENDPKDGAATGPAKGSGKNGGSTKKGGGGASTTPADSGSAPAADAATPAETTPPTATTPTPTPKRPRKPRPAKSEAATPAPAGVPVHGILIAGSDETSIRAAIAASAVPTPAAAARRGSGLGDPSHLGTILAVLAVAALVAVGVVRETRRR